MRDRRSGIRRVLIGISPEQRSPSARNRDDHEPGTVICIAWILADTGLTDMDAKLQQ
jgi:hypothetical protein